MIKFANYYFTNSDFILNINKVAILLIKIMKDSFNQIQTLAINSNTKNYKLIKTSIRNKELIRN